jgi:hypothetical protein
MWAWGNNPHQVLYEELLRGTDIYNYPLTYLLLLVICALIMLFSNSIQFRLLSLFSMNFILIPPLLNNPIKILCFKYTTFPLYVNYGNFYETLFIFLIKLIRKDKMVIAFTKKQPSKAIFLLSRVLRLFSNVVIFRQSSDIYNNNIPSHVPILISAS